jgi:hypothetical protein
MNGGIDAGSTLAERVASKHPPTPDELGNYFNQPLPSLSSVIAPIKDCSMYVIDSQVTCSIAVESSSTTSTKCRVT